MTEEEFVLRLTCKEVTVDDVWEAKTVHGFIQYRTHTNAYYHSTIDLYLTDIDMFIPAGVEFRFVLKSGDELGISLRTSADIYGGL